MGLKILVVGSGGREHTLVWKIAQSKKVRKIYCAPGNAGIASLAELVPLKVEDLDGILILSGKSNRFSCCGPNCLNLRFVDALQKVDIELLDLVTGCGVEGSKVFAKNLMHNYGIPTAEYHIFTERLWLNLFTAKSRTLGGKGRWFGCW